MIAVERGTPLEDASGRHFPSSAQGAARLSKHLCPRGRSSPGSAIPVSELTSQ